MPENKQEPRLLSPYHAEGNKTNDINNNSQWADNSVSVKSQTNINSSANDKLNNRANLVSSVDFELKTPSNYFQGLPVTSGGYTYQINPSTNSEFAYLGLPSIGRSGADLSLHLTSKMTTLNVLIKNLPCFFTLIN